MNARQIVRQSVAKDCRIFGVCSLAQCGSVPIIPIGGFDMRVMVAAAVLALGVLASACEVRMSDGQVFDCHIERVGLVAFAWVCPRVR